MMAEKEKIFDDYRALIEKTDGFTDSLSQIHRRHMRCKAGCSHCCMGYRIFPLEFHFISEALKNHEIVINPETEEGKCCFLVEGLCSIYDVRPFICRTHGLPLLYVNGDDEWELSVCELNFTGFDEDFHFDNTFPQDRFNSELFMLNKAFVALPKFAHYMETDLLPINLLKNAEGKP
ncbi:MAG: YkgJ family cysteine cluster protein [Prolixibacteraceae bacterium]|nr:YkgJ family cysteine cluster protein [Prolixibacteraceae bacterium]